MSIPRLAYVAVPGKQGPPGIPVTGAWAADRTYLQNQIASFAGTAWSSLQNGNLNHEPEEGAWWTVFVQGIGPSGVTPGDYGDATRTLTASVNVNGIITAMAAVLIAIPFTQLTSHPTTVGGYGITNAVVNTTSVIAGTGLAGGGALSANVTLNLADTAVTPGSFGIASAVGQFQVDQQGRIVAAVNVPIAINWSQIVAGLPTTLGGYGIADAVHSSLTLIAGTGLTGGGDLTNNRTFAIADTAVAAGQYGDSSHVGQFTVDQQGRLTQSASIAITPASIGALALTGGTLTGPLLLAADPTSALGAATKQYVDTLAQGLDPKASCVAATTAAVALTGEQTIDGVVLVAGNRILVKNQAAPASNGIYVVAVGAWSRALDMDNWSEVPAAYTFIEQGTANGGSGWVCASPPGGVIGVNAINFQQFAGVGAFVPLSRLVATTGGLQGGGDLTIDRTLSIADTGIVANSYGDGSHVGGFTVNSRGQLTSASAIPIAIDWSQITNGLPTTLGGYGITNGVVSTRTLTAGTGLTGGGDLTNNRTFNLADTAVVAGDFGDITHLVTLSIDQQGRITAAANVALSVTIASGGTGITAYTAGDTLYYAAGSALSKLAIGAANTVMVSTGSAPSWATSLNLSGSATFGTGLTVSSGTTALQAITGTTVVLSSTAKATAFIDAGTNPASAGIVRLRNAQSVAWRNAANSADLTLGVNASDVLVSSGALTASGAFVASVGATVTSGGFTVSSGTSALQAITGTTLVLSSTATATAFIDAGSNPASAGIIRLRNAQNVAWRNNANSADITLGVTSGDIMVASGAFTASGAFIASVGATITTGGLTVSGGTTAVQAFTATSVSVTNNGYFGAASGYASGVNLATKGIDGTTSNIGMVMNSGTSGQGTYMQQTDGATYNSAHGVDGSGNWKWFAGRFAGTAGTQVMSLTTAGALTVASTLTVTAGGLTVSSGTTSVQAFTATTIGGTTATLSGNVILANGSEIRWTTTNERIYGDNTAHTLTFDTNGVTRMTVGTTVTIASGFAVSAGTTAVQALTATTIIGSGEVGTNTRFASTTSNATQALSSTAMNLLVNITYGAILMGYGSSYDVSIFNKSQQTVMLVATGTQNVAFSGSGVFATGLTVSSGTSALQAMTCTTGTASTSMTVGDGTSHVTISKNSTGGITFAVNYDDSTGFYKFQLRTDGTTVTPVIIAQASVTVAALLIVNGLSNGATVSQFMGKDSGTDTQLVHFGRADDAVAGSLKYYNSLSNLLALNSETGHDVGITVQGAVVSRFDNNTTADETGILVRANGSVQRVTLTLGSAVALSGRKYLSVAT